MDYEIKRVYKSEETASKYDKQFTASLRSRLTGQAEERAFQRMLAAAPPHIPAQTNVVDIACGTGRFTEQLLTRGYQTTGSDVSPQMLEVARAKLSGRDNLVDLVTGDAEALPFEDGQFDGVVCMRLYQRVPSEARVRMLSEVRRVGRGWAVLFFAMSTPWLDARRAMRARLLSRHSTITHPITFQELHTELQAAGLTMARSTWTLPGLSDGIVLLVTW